MELGVQSGHPDRVLLDTCLMLGLDFLWLDAEHTDLTPREVEAFVARARGSSTRVAVRVPSSDPDTLLTFANTGVDEIVLPRVKDTADIVEAGRVLAYPPKGLRPRQVVPASGFGHSWTSDVRLSVIVETVSAYDAAADIAASAVVDTVWIGTKDLKDALEQGGRSEAADMRATVATLAGRLAGQRARIGIGATELAGIETAAGLGADRCSVYWERYITACIRALLDARQATAGQPIGAAGHNHNSGGGRDD